MLNWLKKVVSNWGICNSQSFDEQTGPPLDEWTHPPLHGGTETHTASGELRWDYQSRHGDELIYKHDSFRHGLIETEHLNLFAQFAESMRAMPESRSDGGSQWNSTLSPPAAQFLNDLEDLHAVRPRLALKIAAIATASSWVHYVYTKEVTSRMFDWMVQRNIPVQERLVLGILIRDTWPDGDPPKQFEKVLLDLLVQDSIEAPEHAAQIFRSLYGLQRKRTSYVICIVDEGVQNFV